MGWTVVGIVVVVLAIMMMVWQARKATLLAHQGEILEGTLLRKFRNKKGFPVFTYKYSAPDGSHHEGLFSANEEEWEAYEAGDPIEIVYVPSKPSLSGSKRLINQSRKALKLPPL